MGELVQVKAEIPRDLKRRAFAELALREEKFNRWLRTQMELLLIEGEGGERGRNDDRLAGSEARR